MPTPGATPTSRTTAPSAAPGTPTPTSALTIGARLGLGQRLTIAEARSQVTFPVLLPTLPDLGAPDEVYLGQPPVGGQVSLVWLPRADLPAAPTVGVALLFTQFRADLDPGFIKKIVGAQTTVRFLTVNGGQGYWIEGEPHEFLYQNGQGVFAERTRLAGNVLIWEVDGLTYRIEGPRTLDEALRIAASLR